MSVNSQLSLIEATHVSKGGNPGADNATNGTLRIIFKDWSVREEGEKKKENETKKGEEPLPRSGGGERNNSTATNETEPFQYHYPGVDFCLVPNVLRLRVLYTRASEPATSEPIFRVAGLEVSPLASEWEWRCVEKASKHCADVQNFPLALQGSRRMR